MPESFTVETSPPGGGALAAGPGADLGEDEAYDIGLQAWVYGYPVAWMYRLRHGFVFDPSNPLRTPVNRFRHRRKLLDASFRAVASANVDTLYSSAWLDLSQGPVLLEYPEMEGRYFVFHCLDFFSNTFAEPGLRTMGDAAGRLCFTGPGWEGETPPGARRIPCPTRSAWVIGRTLADGADDLPVVHALQDRFILSAPAPPAPRPAPPAPNPAEPLDLFRLLSYGLTENAPPPGDAGLMALFGRIGVGPGRHFEPARLTAPTARGLRRAAEAAARLVAVGGRGLTPLPGGWAAPPTNLGAFENDFLFRAEVAMKWPAPVTPQEAVYFIAEQDADGAPLDGRRPVTLRFRPETIPPVDAFWSVTLYRLPERRFHPNRQGRHAVGDRTPGLRREPDGGLEISIGADPPHGEDDRNWLPAPNGPYSLILRAYLPRPALLRGEWSPPPLEKPA